MIVFPVQTFKDKINCILHFFLAIVLVSPDQDRKYGFVNHSILLGDKSD